MSQWSEVVRSTSENCWQFLRYLVRRFFQDGCQDSAASLTYITLFALVPMLTLMFAMFQLVPAAQGLEGQLQSFIFNNFLPASGDKIQSYLEEFTAQARTLRGWSAAVLVVTSYMMLANIEKTFNNIWGTAGSRKGLSSFLLYWAILSLGPLLIGIGLSMNIYGALSGWLTTENDVLGLGAILLKILPLLFNWAAVSLLFIAVPNCRVSIRSALIGGLVTMLLFEALRSGFGLVVANSSYTTMYGAFAIVPLFLLWIFLAWTLLLFGAEVVRSLETFKTATQGYAYPHLVASLVILSRTYDGQQRGGGVTDRDLMRAGIDQQHWRQLRNLFLEHKILALTDGGRYVVARDLYKLPISELVELFGENFTTRPSTEAASSLEQYSWFGCLSGMLVDFNDKARPIMSKTVGELFDDKNETIGA